MSETGTERASIDRVADAARALGLDIDILRMAQSTRTAADAAAAAGCDVGAIVKSLVFDGGDTLVLLLVSGAHDADLAAVGRRIGRTLARCDARRVREVTGFAIGGVAPLGHKAALPVYMDAALLAHPTVWCAAGRPDAIFAVHPRRLADATGAELVEVGA